MNFADILEQHAIDRPDHPAIEDGERIISFGELAGLVRERAANLYEMGIRPHTIVAVILPDSADHLITLWALARSGAVIFSLAPYMRRQDIEKCLASVQTRVVIAPAAMTSPDAGGNGKMVCSDPLAGIY